MLMAVCVPATFPRSKPISLSFPREQGVRTVNLFERDHVRRRGNNRLGWAAPGAGRCRATDGARMKQYHRGPDEEGFLEQPGNLTCFASIEYCRPG